MPKRGYNSDRAWQTRQAKLAKEHEMKLALIDLFKTDPSWFYKIGIITGSMVSVASALGASVKEELPGAVFPNGIDLPGFSKAVFAGGLTFTTWCAMMLTIPAIFGPDGVQIETSASGFGVEGEVKIG